MRSYETDVMGLNLTALFHLSRLEIAEFFGKMENLLGKVKQFDTDYFGTSTTYTSCCFHKDGTIYEAYYYSHDGEIFVKM